jgi:hypothetical protein
MAVQGTRGRLVFRCLSGTAIPSSISWRRRKSAVLDDLLRLAREQGLWSGAGARETRRERAASDARTTREIINRNRTVEITEQVPDIGGGAP